MSRNFEIITFLFNTACLYKNFIDINESNYFIWGKYSKLYLPVNEHINFVDSYEEQNISMCILDLDYEPLFQLLDSETCMVEHTNQIYYNQNNTLVKKPDAWDIDYLNFDKDNLFSYDIIHKDQVELWILDTGINWRHSEFFPGQVIDVDPDFTIANISNPHGTGTSACAGGLNYGSSKGFSIFNFPVCRSGGSCRGSDIDKGFFKVLERLNQTNKRLVVNLSVGVSLGTDPTNTSLGLYYNNIFKMMTQKGGILVTSAGNSNEDACTWLYSFSPYVISVGALDQNYHKAGFSNWGECVDIWSFGSGVPTAYSTTDNFVVQFKSGTSFSSPLMAGLVANVLSENQTLSREEILQILYMKINNFTVPYYNCGNLKKHCCVSENSPGFTRKDQYCRSFDINHCPRSCTVKFCTV